MQLALQEAVSWQEQARWPEALAAARRAEGLLAGGSVHEGLQQRVRQRRADLEMVLRLDEIRLESSAVREGGFDTAAREAAYAQAFGDYGIDVLGIGPREATERIWTKSIQVQLAAALDDWARLRKQTPKRGVAAWKDLLAMARAADPDPWRNRLRASLEGSGAKRLEELAASAPISELPTPTLIFLGEALRENALLDKAIDILRKAQRQHPNDFWINEALGLYLTASQPPQWDEAIRFYTVAVALRPQSPGAHLNLGYALSHKGAQEEAIAAYQEALRLKPDVAEPYNNLGVALGKKGALDEAIAAFKQALRLKPDDAEAYSNLGNALTEKGALDEAIAACKEALRLKPDYAEAYFNLGVALHKKRALDEAIAAYQEALRLKPDFADAYTNLGIALQKKGALEEAIAAHKQAVRLKPDLADAYNNLGTALEEKGALDEAIAAYRNAVRLKPDYAMAYYNLGLVLQRKGALDEATAAYKEAISRKPDYAEAYCNLGSTLQRQGHFTAALAALRRGHELGSKVPHWPYPSARWVAECERLIAADRRLPEILAGKAQPRDAPEALGLAELCQQPFKSLYAASARFYSEAFTAQPQLAEALQAGHRYNAACAAALAAAGQGKDAPKPEAAEQARWRRQAVAWLRADLTAWASLRGSPLPQVRTAVQRTLAHWQEDPDLAGVRGEAALARLPAAERQAWRRLWADVTNTLAQTGSEAVPEESSKKKP